MKPIKCPNCGKRMEIISGLNRVSAKGSRAYTSCRHCGVQGPSGDAATERGAAIVAARLTREWIARMEVKTCVWAEKCPVKNRRIVIEKDLFMSKIIDDFTNAKAPEFLPRSRKQGSEVTP